MKEVKIGKQIWSAENLALTKDKEGNELVLGKDYFFPCGMKILADKYGLLYTWDAAMRVVPNGWHLPTKEEFKELVAILPIEEYANRDEWRKGPLALKESTLFNALPAGSYRGSYYNFGDYAYFWSATENNSYGAYSRYLYYDSAIVYRYYNYKCYGFSVRCIKD